MNVTKFQPYHPHSSRSYAVGEADTSGRKVEAITSDQTGVCVRFTDGSGLLFRAMGCCWLPAEPAAPVAPAARKGGK